MTTADSNLLRSGLAAQARREGIPFRPGYRRDLREFQQRGEQILGLAQAAEGLPSGQTLRMPDQQRKMADFFVNSGGPVHAALHEFADHVVLAEVMAVIGTEDDD